MKKTKQTYWGNLAAVSLGILIALLLAEVISRVWIPMFPGTKKLSLNGEVLNIDSVHPGAVYRQYSEEYDVVTTITLKGYRIPEVVDNPHVIFLGDSFTFGQGLSDEHTFPFLFCQSLLLSCANLSVPGASTISELDRLEEFLSGEGWRPQHVFLFIFAMTHFLGAGNDLYDNIKTFEQAKKMKLKAHFPRNFSPPSSVMMNTDMFSEFLNFLLDFRKSILQHSNFARVLKFYFGPQLKELLAPPPKEEPLNHALSLMKDQLSRFERLGEQFDFSTHVFLIHPVQDILRGSYHDTILKLQAISPKTIHSTANLFLPHPEQYFFSLDGHLNKKGSQKIANYLLKDFNNLGQE